MHTAHPPPYRICFQFKIVNTYKQINGLLLCTQRDNVSRFQFPRAKACPQTHKSVCILSTTTVDNSFLYCACVEMLHPLTTLSLLHLLSLEHPTLLHFCLPGTKQTFSALIRIFRSQGRIRFSLIHPLNPVSSNFSCEFPPFNIVKQFSLFFCSYANLVPLTGELKLPFGPRPTHLDRVFPIPRSNVTLIVLSVALGFVANVTVVADGFATLLRLLRYNSYGC